MTTYERPRGLSPRFRLQLILVLMIGWDALGLIAEVAFGGGLFKIKGAEIGGILSARGAFNGALVVPLALYIYALRNPLRYRGLLWVGVLEHGVAALAAVYHLARDDISTVGAILSLIVALAIVVLLLLNMPRGQTT